jgi:hypothetical protein
LPTFTKKMHFLSSGKNTELTTNSVAVLWSWIRYFLSKSDQDPE